MPNRPKRRPTRRPEVTSTETRGAVLLRSYMKENDLTQMEVAKRIECTRSHVGMLLGGSPPSLSVAARIERALGIKCIEWTEDAGKIAA